MIPTSSPTPPPGRRSRTARGLLALVVAGALLTGLTACGGDDGGSDAAATTTAAGTATSAASAAAPEASPSLPVTVRDSNGKEVTITDVSRIIPLNGDLAEVVFALGLGPNVVATDVSATYPAEAAAAPKIGYQRQLAAEGILSFSPTVVLGTTDAGPPPVIEQLRAAGLTVVILPPNRELEQVPAKVRSVAAALGVPGRGEELAGSIEDEVAAAEEKAAKVDGKPRAAGLYLRGASTQMIFGKGAGADQLLVAAGATDAAGEVGINGTVPITPEALVQLQPDVLVVTTTGLQSVGGIDGLLAIPGIAQTPAGQNRRVLAYEDQFLLGGGPRIGQALTQLVGDLHSGA